MEWTACKESREEDKRIMPNDRREWGGGETEKGLGHS